jgi:hypothetical protein
MHATPLDKLLFHHFGYGKVEWQDEKDESGETIAKGSIK